MRKYNTISIILLVFAVLFCISAVIGTVSAADTENNTTANFTNPGFESGNLSDWTAGSGVSITNNSHSGQYGAHFNNMANQSADNLTQTVNLTNVSNITFWGYGEGTLGTTYSLYVYIDYNLVQTIIPSPDAWTQYTIPTKGYTGLHNVTITWYGQCMYGAAVDDFSINAPTANFTSNTTNGTSPLTVQFTDTSTDNPTSWNWDFGDGTTSTEQNPIHTYTTPRIYTVKLTATNEADHNKVSDNGQITKTNYITVMDATVPVVVAQPSGGPYNTTLNVNLITIDPYGSTTTYYTTDGTDPRTSSSRVAYTESIQINTTTTLRYIAVNSKDIWSSEYSQTYTIDTIAPTVTADLAGGTYNTTKIVTLTTTDPNSSSTTYYTTDSSDPRTSNTRIQYTGSITINATTTLRYAAVDPAGNWSPLYLQNYVIGTGAVTNNTGQFNYTGPQTNNTDWTYIITDGEKIVGSAAVGSDGTIYIGTYNDPDHSGSFYAINPNGTLKWKYNTGGGIMGSPAIGADGTIYVGTYWGVLYAFNPNGTVNWTYNTGNTIYSSPIIGADGTIYTGTWSLGRLYAINPNGTLKWIYKAGNIRSSPVIGSDGTIYVGEGVGQDFYAINPDGTLKWAYHLNTTFGHTSGSPAIGSDGTIYFADTDGHFYALNPDGTPKWYLSSGGGNPSIGADGTIYLESWGTIYALNPADGTQKWTYSTNSGAYGSITIGADGTLYFGTITALQGYGVDTPGSDLYVLNPDGKLKWTYHVGGVHGTPAIGPYGTLYVGGYATNTFYAFKDDTTKPTVTATPSGGDYYSPQNVVLAASETSDIYYTLDGTDPTTNGKKYTGTIPINTTTTLKFAAVDLANNWSSVYTEKYSIYAWTPYSYPVTVQYRLSNKKYKIKYRVAYTVKKKVKKKWVLVTKYKWKYKWDYRYGYRTETRWGNHWVLT